MKLILDYQKASASGRLPADADLTHWAAAALRGRRDRAELTVRAVDEAESARLNLRYRGKEGPTNVLSFPFAPPPGMPDMPLIGDLVVCAPLVEREASEQGKDLTAHWAHMVVHGVLHLLGHDHADEAEAAVMENLESALMGRLGFPEPYPEQEPG